VNNYVEIQIRRDYHYLIEYRVDQSACGYGFIPLHFSQMVVKAPPSLAGDDRALTSNTTYSRVYSASDASPQQRVS
jgi:hypothetical protein